jgi:hypothetical protein
MKNYILVLGSLTFSLALFSQFPNGGFEAWENLGGYDNPDVSPSEFSSVNDQVYWQSGMIPVSEVPGQSGSALRIETVEVDGEISPGFAILGGTPSGDEDPLIFPGGFPFADMAVTGIQADLRYLIDESSPGYIVVQFKANGLPVSGGPDDGGTFFFPIFGDVSVFTTTAFSFDPPLTQMPDSCVVGFISNDLLSEPATGFVGNFLEVDNLMFTGTAETIPGGDMDTWIPGVNIQVPEEWDAFIYGPIESIVQSDDSYEGSFSCQLNTLDINDERLAGVLYKGELSEEGILATEEIPDDALGLDFAYKYLPVMNDTALVLLVLSEDLENSPDGLAFIGLPLVASDWQTQQLNWEWILEWLNPQYYALVIASSNFDNLEFLEGGSQLWVDSFEWYIDPNACSFEPEIVDAPPILCPDESFMLTATECDSYTWYRKLIGLPGDPEMVGDGSQTLEVDVANYSGYFVWVECTVDGCTEASDPVTVDGWVFAPPGIASDGISDICEGESTVLENAFGSYATYQWVNNGVDINGADASTYEVTESGQYTLTVTPEECPDFEMTSGVPVTITVHELPTPVIEIALGELTTTESYTTYQWYSPDVATGDVVSETSTLFESNPDIVGNSAQVVVTDQWGCEGVSDVVVWLGIDDIDLNSSITVSPNPARNWVSVSFAGFVPDVFRLLDITGKEVANWPVNRSTTTYDLSDLPSGVYLMSVLVGKQTVTKRLVKL